MNQTRFTYALSLVPLLLACVSPAHSLATSPIDVLRASNATLHRFALDNGMIGLVKEAMERHPEDESVQGCACDALAGIAKGDPGSVVEMVGDALYSY